MKRGKRSLDQFLIFYQKRQNDAASGKNGENACDDRSCSKMCGADIVGTVVNGGFQQHEQCSEQEQRSNCQRNDLLYFFIEFRKSGNDKSADCDQDEQIAENARTAPFVLPEPKSASLNET